ncbi:hypothetical protein FA15DRAFT_464558 [Coprinopsis marcescibilis]|uniref:DUF6533 domain-containing protein n=1 Tax=Coprinopsis marcescibilis TaxID=230819 RepID=A0A5C3KUF3_COPMA|nr:hypothetical protein FA15DRAFT_464558 [Coprinopsis marcescibilis]
MDSVLGLSIKEQLAMLDRFKLTLYFQRNIRYLNASSLTVLIADYLQTVDLETKLIWGSDWTLVKVLYLVSRYSPFFDVPLTVYYNEAMGISPELCYQLLIVLSASIVFGSMIAEGSHPNVLYEGDLTDRRRTAILFLRVAALLGRKRRMNIYLAVHYVIAESGLLTAFIMFIVSLKFGQSPVPKYINCMIVDSNFLPLIAVFGIILFNQAAVMLISVWIGIRKYRNSKGPLVGVFYRDGAGYFILLSMMSAVNLIVAAVGPPEYKYLFAAPQRVLHSTLSTRMVLHLREITDAQRQPTAELSRQQSFKFIPDTSVMLSPTSPTASQHTARSSWNVVDVVRRERDSIAKSQLSYNAYAY